MEKVSLRRVEEYDLDKLIATIGESLGAVGFDPASFKGKRVALKPNIMIPFAVERAVVTHPTFLEAAARVVADNGGKPILLECPGVSPLGKAAKSIGYVAVAERVGMEIADESPILVLKYDGAKTFKSFEVAAAFADVDIIVNLPKLKTHGFMYMSGAVKNLLGTIPGLRKAQMHMRAPDKADFGDLLVDLNLALLNGFEKPKKILHVVDAIIGQEGEGPGPAGVPRKINSVIVGIDPVAVDWVAASVVGLDPKLIPTMVAGFARKEFVSSPGEIEVVGDSISSLAIKDFKATRSTLPSHIYRGFLVGKRARNLVMDRPNPSPDKCSLCYQCKNICPAKAISKTSDGRKIPTFDYDKCIRCFCCIEVCPEAAIGLKKGKLHWLTKVKI